MGTNVSQLRRHTPIYRQSTGQSLYELNHPDTKNCAAGCPFRKLLHNRRSSPYFCAYALMAGHMRGCLPSQCNVQSRREEYEALPAAAKLPYGRSASYDPENFPVYEEAVGM